MLWGALTKCQLICKLRCNSNMHFAGFCEKKNPSTSIREKTQLNKKQQRRTVAAIAAPIDHAALDLQVKWLSICIASGMYQKYSDFCDTKTSKATPKIWCVQPNLQLAPPKKISASSAYSMCAALHSAPPPPLLRACTQRIVTKIGVKIVKHWKCPKTILMVCSKSMVTRRPRLKIKHYFIILSARRPPFCQSALYWYIPICILLSTYAATDGLLPIALYLHCLLGSSSKSSQF